MDIIAPVSIYMHCIYIYEQVQTVLICIVAGIVVFGIANDSILSSD